MYNGLIRVFIFLSENNFIIIRTITQTICTQKAILFTRVL